MNYTEYNNQLKLPDDLYKKTLAGVKSEISKHNQIQRKKKVAYLSFAACFMILVTSISTVKYLNNNSSDTFETTHNSSTNNKGFSTDNRTIKIKIENTKYPQKIIIDNNRVNKEKPSFTLEDHFEVYRVDVMSERYKNIMHRKFCVIDLEVAMHGTFNWTNAANYNKEHWDVDHNRETAKTFAEEFVKMRRDAELSMLWLDF